MLGFYAFAVVYLAIGLWVARRAPGRARRAGLRAQLAVTAGILAVGLFWPDRCRTFGSGWHNPFSD